MARTYAEVVDLIESILIDGGIDPGGSANQVFATAELDLWIKNGLAEISRYRPYRTKETLTTTASSRDLTLSAENKRKLLWIDKLEYLTGYDPKNFRTFTRWGDTVTMGIDNLPASAVSVYLYLAKIHRLQKEIGTSDVAGTIHADTAAGVTSLVLDDLGTGTINEDTVLEITGDTTDYVVTATATIAANSATVSITPALAAAAAADAVVALSLSASTLDAELEELLAALVAGKAAIQKARIYVGNINIGAGNTASEMAQWGTMLLNDTIRRLRQTAERSAAIDYSRD